MTEPEPWSREWKEAQLYRISEEWANCEACPLHNTRTHVVVGSGNPDAKIMLIGEGPGDEEDITGEPFKGPSGKLLRGLVKNAKLEWDSLFVTNIVGCRPIDEHKKNRDPQTAERDACLPRVFDLIYIVDPWVIVPVGKVSLKALAKGRDWPITTHHGVLFSTPTVKFKRVGDRNGAEVSGVVFPKKDTEKRVVNLEYDLIPILHPSFLLREDYDEKTQKFSPDGVTQQTFQDLKRIKEYIDVLEADYAKAPVIAELYRNA